MQSSATTAFANVSTFTFYDTYYSSKYVILESVERYSSLNPTGAKYLSLQIPDQRQRAAVANYASSATTFPLLDVANRWVLNGASFTPSVLMGLSQDQIAGDLSSSQSPLTQAVVSAANEITASICAVDGQKPGSVCDEPRGAGGGSSAGDHAAGVGARRRCDLGDGGTGVGAGARCVSAGVTQLARRSSTILRSTSLRPPQMPWGSRIRMA